MRYLLPPIFLFLVGCSLDDSTLVERNVENAKESAAREEFCRTFDAYTVDYFKSQQESCEATKLKAVEEYERVIAKLTPGEVDRWTVKTGVDRDCHGTVEVRIIQSQCRKFVTSAWGWYPR